MNYIDGNEKIRLYERIIRDILEKNYSENLISLLQTILKYCSKNYYKISKTYLGLCQTIMREFFPKIIKG